MVRRLLVGAGVLLALAVAVPPLWFAFAPEPAPDLPGRGRRVLLSSGVGVNLVELGDGAPVVLVHGLPGSAADWRATSTALAGRGRRSLAYDRVGYAYSDPRPDDDFTLEANAEELLGLLEALDLRDATVVGWSYGGGTALVAAHRDATRIGRLVLVGSVGPGFEAQEPPALAGLLFSGPVLAWIRSVPPVGRALQAGMSRVAYSDQPEPDWWLPSLAANFAQPHTPRTWSEEGRRMPRGDPPDSAGLSVPVLVVHGDDDRLVPLAVGRALAERAPEGTLRVVEGGSHMLPVTHAAVLADAIAGFDGR